MSTNTITSTREAILKDTDHLKHDAGQIVADVKKHATAHVEAVKARVNDTFDLARNCVNEHPLKLVGGALLIGFLIGTFSRK